MCPLLAASSRPALQPVVASQPIVDRRTDVGQRAPSGDERACDEYVAARAIRRLLQASDESRDIAIRKSAGGPPDDERRIVARDLRGPSARARPSSSATALQPRGAPALDAVMFEGCLRGIANRRATQIGLEPLYPNEENPFPWMSETIDLKKELNFLRHASSSTCRVAR